MFFEFGLAFLFSHEIDAIQNHEWRMFPFTFFFEDSVGARVFIALHVPIFAVSTYMLRHQNHNIRKNFIKSINIFNIIHLGLHTLALWCPLNEFKSWFSWSLIIGASICGAFDLYLNRKHIPKNY